MTDDRQGPDARPSTPQPATDATTTGAITGTGTGGLGSAGGTDTTPHVGSVPPGPDVPDRRTSPLEGARDPDEDAAG